VTVSALLQRDVGLAHRIDATLHPDPARVLPRLFLPGEEFEVTRSRSDGVIRRILELSEDEVEILVGDLIAHGTTRHYQYTEMLLQHAATVRAHISSAGEVSSARQLLIGASFTSEVAVEGGALCNPSAVPHPDQSGLGDGQLRLALSVRGIAEGHISSIGFATAIVGPGPRWEFEPRTLPVTSPIVTEAKWSRVHLRRALDDLDRLDEFAYAVLGRLEELFSRKKFDTAVARAQHGPYGNRRIIETTAVMHTVLLSGYQATFPSDVSLDQQVLFPHSPEESKGIEDARFVLFTDDDGEQSYRATYTAYDGHAIAPRLIVSADLRSFRTQRFAGAAAVNKGMALFPRRINGQYLALCRSDGETTSVATSDDGVVWDASVAIHPPDLDWELLQVGNCGPPLETEHGWLVLTHGVGPMRTYSIGAILLDLDDPRRVLRRLTTPLLRPLPSETEGYVPNVVYSCGGIIHNGLLWIPYGIGDARIGVAWAEVNALIAQMEPVTQ
jgi:predicted GH43/DUF377 family glycosyl hydrolase